MGGIKFLPFVLAFLLKFSRGNLDKYSKNM